MKIPQPSNDRKKQAKDSQDGEGSSDEESDLKNIPPPVIKRDPKWKRDYFNLTE